MAKISKFQKIVFVGCLFGLFAAGGFASNLHRFHTSLTRIDYNRKENLFEISIRLFTHDLAPLLEKRAGKNLDLEKSPEVDKLIFDYLNENFILTDKKGAVKKLEWIGKEVGVDTVSVYVQTVSNEAPENFKLKNTVFFESFPEQTNLVVCRYDDKKADLLFKVGDKEKEIVETKPTKIELK